MVVDCSFTHVIVDHRLREFQVTMSRKLSALASWACYSSFWL